MESEVMVERCEGLIDSCTTIKQLENALKYAERAYSTHAMDYSQYLRVYKYFCHKWSEIE